MVSLKTAAARWARAEKSRQEAIEQRDQDIAEIMAARVNGEPTPEEIGDAFGMSRVHVYRAAKNGAPALSAGAPDQENQPANGKVDDA